MTSRPIFVGERITPHTGLFGVAALARGEPEVPKAFVWRGQVYTVARTLHHRKAMGQDRGDFYVRRHYYDVETSDALRMRLYFERNPSDRSKQKAWWLYTFAHPHPTLETPRLFLRRWTFADRDVFRRMTQDPNTMRYLHDGAPLTDAQSDEALRSTIDRYDRLGFGDWAIVEKQTGEVAGESGLDHIEGTSTVEIGWMLLPQFWGRGFGFEAASAVKQYAAGTLGLKHLTALVRPGNLRSIALAAKLGLRETGRTLHRNHEMLTFEIFL
jgi:RimJ/RimL family protein N-acetyltransferase